MCFLNSNDAISEQSMQEKLKFFDLIIDKWFENKYCNLHRFMIDMSEMKMLYF